jgi:serine protease SohB
MKARYGDKVSFKKFGRRRSLIQRFGARVMGDAISTLEERAEFARFGL